MPFIVEVFVDGKWKPDLSRVYETTQEAHENCAENEIVSLVSENDLKVLRFIEHLENDYEDR